MILHPPFSISARLLPALRVGGATISYDRGQFVIDLPDGTECATDSYRAGAGRDLPGMFGDILAFLSACAESRRYWPGGENSDLFPETVGLWAESCSDELDMLRFDIEESETELIEA